MEDTLNELLEFIAIEEAAITELIQLDSLTELTEEKLSALEKVFTETLQEISGE